MILILCLYDVLAFLHKSPLAFVAPSIEVNALVLSQEVY